VTLARGNQKHRRRVAEITGRPMTDKPKEIRVEVHPECRWLGRTKTTMDKVYLIVDGYRTRYKSKR